MCVGCSDFVEDCWLDECYNSNGGPYGLSNKFYSGDEYCRHLKKKYGKEFASLSDVEYDDDSPE